MNVFIVFQFVKNFKIYIQNNSPKTLTYQNVYSFAIENGETLFHIIVLIGLGILVAFIFLRFNFLVIFLPDV